VDSDGGPLHIDGGEKGKPHDVIPVGMGQKDIGADRSLLEVVGHHEIAQLPETGTGIDNDAAVEFGEVQLYARGVSAIFHGF
jgi:hypothetical protein